MMSMVLITNEYICCCLLRVYVWLMTRAPPIITGDILHVMSRLSVSVNLLSLSCCAYLYTLSYAAAEPTGTLFLRSVSR